MRDDLASSLATFEKRPHLLAVAAGKFVVVCGDEVAGAWDTYGDAVQVGYAKFGLRVFLVKRVERFETVHFL